MFRLCLAMVFMTCVTAGVVESTLPCTSKQLFLSRGLLSSWRQYQANLRSYTSQLLTWRRQNGQNNELHNIAVSAYGITDILKMLYLDAPDNLRQQLLTHSLLHNIQPHQFDHVTHLVKQSVLVGACPSFQRYSNISRISLTEVYLRLPTPYGYFTEDDEMFNWDFVSTEPSHSDINFRSPLDLILRARPVVGVKELLRDHTDGSNESLVAINVANFRALWKFPTITSDTRIKFRMSASLGNLNFEMLEAITSTGVHRYLQCEVNGVYKCRRRGMPNIYEIPLLASSGQEFRMMIYQTTQNLTLQKIQEKFSFEGAKRWKLQGRSKANRKPATIIIPKFNMTTYYDLIGHMVKKGTETRFEREFTDIYGGHNTVFPVVYQATKLLAITQFSVSEKGISMENTVNTNHSTVPLTSRNNEDKFFVDSPFMFAIEHVNSNTLITAGRVTGRM